MKKKNISDKLTHSEDKKNPDKITRKEAIKKAGKYAALTAVTTLIILNPKQSQAGSVPTAPGW